MKFLRWLLFSWAVFGCMVMSYFLARWLFEPPSPLHNELLIGFGMGLVACAPPLLGLPVLAYLGRSSLSRWHRYCLLCPSALAALMFGVLAAAGGL